MIKTLVLFGIVIVLGIIAESTNFYDDITKKAIHKISKLLFWIMIVWTFTHGTFTLESHIEQQNINDYGSYRYEIIIPNGKYPKHYYARTYEYKEGGSISFVNQYGDIVASPTYTIGNNKYYKGDNK